MLPCEQPQPTMRHRVMLVDETPGRAAILEQALRDEGYDVVARLTTGQDLEAEVLRVRPDVIIVDMDSPDRDTLEHMSSISRHLPRPILLFAEHGDSDTITAAVRAGVSAYVADGFSQRRLRPILEVAIARFREFQALRSELEETRSKLADRKDVEKAKGELMRRKGLTEEQAYKALRKMAMDRNQRIGDVARNLLAVMELID